MSIREERFAPGLIRALRLGKPASGVSDVQNVSGGQSLAAVAHGRPLLAVRFVGHVPSHEESLLLLIDDEHRSFPLEEIGYVEVGPGKHTVFLKRGGAIKTGTIEIRENEIVVLEFHFSRFGITFSKWLRACEVFRPSGATGP
jgi:hypothetical protein